MSWSFIASAEIRYYDRISEQARSTQWFSLDFCFLGNFRDKTPGKCCLLSKYFEHLVAGSSSVVVVGVVVAT